MLPRTRVVLELKFIDHDDALFHRAHLSALSATHAILIVDVVKTVRGRVETLVRTFGPAERTLRTEVESDGGSLRLRGATLEAWVSILPPGAHLEAALYGRDHSSFLHL